MLATKLKILRLSKMIILKAEFLKFKNWQYPQDKCQRKQDWECHAERIFYNEISVPLTLLRDSFF